MRQLVDCSIKLFCYSHLFLVCRMCDLQLRHRGALVEINDRARFWPHLITSENELGTILSILTKWVTPNFAYPAEKNVAPQGIQLNWSLSPLSLYLSLSLSLSLYMYIYFSPQTLSLPLSPSLPLSLSPSLPLFLSPSLPLSLSSQMALSALLLLWLVQATCSEQLISVCQETFIIANCTKSPSMILSSLSVGAAYVVFTYERWKPRAIVDDKLWRTDSYSSDVRRYWWPVWPEWPAYPHVPLSKVLRDGTTVSV